MRPHPQARRVLALTLVLAMLGTAAALALNHPIGGSYVVFWWALAPAFALAEVAALRLRPAWRRALVPGFVAAPLVVGLLLATPVDVLVGRVLATTGVGVVWRDRRALRLGLDAARGAAAVAAAQTVVMLLSPGFGPATDPRHAVAAVLGAVVAGLLDVAIALMVAGWFSGRSPARTVLGQLAGAAGSALVVGAGGAGLAVVVPAIPYVGQATVVTATIAAVLTVQRTAQSLADRRRSLQRLHELSDALVAAPRSADVVGLVLVQSLALIGARYAEATLDPARCGHPTAHDLVGCWVLRAGQSPVGPRPAIGPGAETLPGAEGLGDGDRGYLVVTRLSPLEQAFLDARGLQDALVVPLRSDGAVIGHLVVGDRLERGAVPTDADGRLLETVANHASVALRNDRLIHRLHVEARQDELTGLPNRLQLRELLDDTARQAAHGGGPCSVMVLDLNGFKAVNDTLGHQAGDELLQVLAARLSQAAACRATVARLGGDEFAVLSTACGDAASARSLATGLLTVFTEPVVVSGARLRVGGSIGISLGPEHGSTGSDLLRQADIAMYAAKSAGGGQRIYSADLVEETAAGLTLATDLRDAVERGEISVVALPMVDLANGELHSVEILARWHHPELGEVPPEQFFAAAERSGLVQELSAAVLDQALALARRGADQGLRLRVAVNLASRWLTDPTLPEQVGVALARQGVAADLLCLELTERSVIADPRRTNSTLARLRAMGVHLSVDDFGTGYSSLTYLSRLPVDQMKIDKSFVAELDASDRDRAIVRSMIDLGCNLGLEVVAEGVSTPEGRQVLAELGCHLGQGYLIARPLDPEDLLARLAGGTAVWAPAGVPSQRERVASGAEIRS